jgi:hypothetical protein
MSKSTMRVSARVLLTALLAGGVGAFLGHSCAGRRTDPAVVHVPRDLAMQESAEDMASRARPALRGRPGEASVAQPAAPASTQHGLIEGLILDDAGRPVPGALVYVLPKGVQGAHDPTVVPNAASDEGGRFRLELASFEGCWLGALAPGMLPGHVDCDAVADRHAVVIRLAPGGIVRVIAKDGMGGLGTTAYVRVESVRGPGSSPLPAPGVDASVVVTGTTADRGEVVLRVGTRGPVLVRAVRWGYYSVPRAVSLPEPLGEVTFEFEKSCGLRITVLEANSRRPVTTWFSVDVTDHATGELINGAAASNPFGEYELRDRLPPGRVDVRIRSRGYHEEVLRDIELETGRRTSVQVALRADETVGDLVITIPPLADIVAATRSERPPHPRILMRLARTEDAWVFAPDFALEPEGPAYRISALREGAYDLLVCHLADRRVCVLRDVIVKRGEQTQVAAPIAEGLDLPLREYADGRTDLRIRRLLDATGRDLPLYRAQGADVTVYAAGEGLPTGLILGPYPMGEIRLEIDESRTPTISRDVGK